MRNIQCVVLLRIAKGCRQTQRKKYCPYMHFSEYVFTQVFVLYKTLQLFPHHFIVNGDDGIWTDLVWHIEEKLVEQSAHDGVKSSRSNILYLGVDREGHSGNLFYCFLGKGNLNPFRFKQRFVLLRQSVLWLGQDAYKILLGQVSQFNTDRKAPLKFGNEVGRLGDMERSRRDKQDMVGLDDPMFGIHRTTLHNGKKIPLNALPADVRATSTLLRSRGDLVYFINEDYARIFSLPYRFFLDFIHVNQFCRFFFEQDPSRLRHSYFPFTCF